MLCAEQLESRILLDASPLFRVNAGGPELVDVPVWAADTNTAPSPYVNAATGNSNTNMTSASIDVSDPSIPLGAPPELFQSQRWDKGGGGEMEWDFPVTSGDYQVRLYFAETRGAGQFVGSRVFNVALEGESTLR